MPVDLQDRPFYPEFEFQTSRSSGAGGQNINKVSSKVELRFHVQNSTLLSDEEKALIHAKAGNKINKEGFLQLFSQASRSQLVNKQNTVKAFYSLLAECFHRKKARKPTKASTSSKLKRLNTKKITSRKKTLRGNNINDDEL